MIVTNYKKSLRGSGEAGKTTQQITHSSKVSHAQGKCYHGYYMVYIAYISILLSFIPTPILIVVFLKPV